MISVLSVQIFKLDTPINVYDLTIEEDESFILANGVIAHNSTICLARHGLQYDSLTHEPIGHNIPYLTGCPYHPNCRSTMQPSFRDGGLIQHEDVGAWLRRQSTQEQDAILGPSRAKLFRDGTLKQASDLLAAVSGRPLTLDELGD